MSPHIFLHFSYTYLPVLQLFLSLILAVSATKCPPLEVVGHSKTENARLAESLGLDYVEGFEGKIERVKAGKGYRYVGPKHKEVSAKDKERIEALGIPPGHTQVRIATNPKSHIQATAVSESGKIQYYYHPDWVEAASSVKFDRAGVFGSALDKIRKKARGDLKKEALSKERALALAVMIMDMTAIRVGNQESAAEGSFGLTTLKPNQVSFKGNQVTLKFKGKSGVQQDISFESAQVAEALKALQKSQHKTLLTYRDARGQLRSLKASDVNEYLKETSGTPVTAKDFRTWKGSVAALKYLIEHSTEGVTLKDLGAASAQVLGNTPSVSLNAYIHPKVQELVDNPKELSALLKKKKRDGMTLEESLLLELIQ